MVDIYTESDQVAECFRQMNILIAQVDAARHKGLTCPHEHRIAEINRRQTTAVRQEMSSGNAKRGWKPDLRQAATARQEVLRRRP